MRASQCSFIINKLSHEYLDSQWLVNTLFVGAEAAIQKHRPFILTEKKCENNQPKGASKMGNNKNYQQKGKIQ